MESNGLGVDLIREGLVESEGEGTSIGGSRNIGQKD